MVTDKFLKHFLSQLYLRLVCNTYNKSIFWQPFNNAVLLTALFQLKETIFTTKCSKEFLLQNVNSSFSIPSVWKPKSKNQSCWSKVWWLMPVSVFLLFFKKWFWFFFFWPSPLKKKRLLTSCWTNSATCLVSDIKVKKTPRSLTERAAATWPLIRTGIFLLTPQLKTTFTKSLTTKWTGDVCQDFMQ